MIDPGVAWDKLSNFETAEEIREYFQSEGIRAICGDNRSCAISQWFLNITGVDYVSVASDIKIGNIIHQDVNGFIQTGLVYTNTFNHTPATLDFIDKFDAGEYLELQTPNQWNTFVDYGDE